MPCLLFTFLDFLKIILKVNCLLSTIFRKRDDWHVVCNNIREQEFLGFRNISKLSKMLTGGGGNAQLP